MTFKINHPLITPKRKTAWIIIVLICLAAFGAYTFYSRMLASSQTTNATGIQTATAQRGDLVLSASGTGTLIAQAQATFGFETSGQITDVFVKIGDQVEAGQVLAQLDNNQASMEFEEAGQALQELHSAAAIATVEQEIATAKDAEFYARAWLEYLLSPEVVEAEENLSSAEQRLAEAQAAAKANPSAVADQAVKEKEKAVAFLKDKLAQAQEYYQKYYLPENFGEYENVGSRRYPKQVLVTYIDPYTGKEVPEINGPSAADITTARNNYAQAQETVQEGEIYLEALSTGVIPAGATGKKLNELYDAQLAVQNAQSALDATKLTAPIRGTITAVDLLVGEQAGSSSVITISRLSQPYTLDVYLDEADWIVAAKAGNKVTVTFTLLPEQTFPGTVTLVYPELSPSFESSLVHLVVQMDQSLSQDLPAGTGATVEVVGGQARGAILVPVGALHETDNGKFIVYIVQNGKPVEREVQVGLKNASYAEIKSGLEAGASVVTR